ncbi:uncharacterized protein [Coffea arabica]|uniref:Uncharacterized protein n=1 Tax=Coffea arabica TaxID=13443 RepID=A0ABM4UR24_COFAR
MDITVLESNDDNLYITHDLEIMQSELQDESDNEEEIQISIHLNEKQKKEMIKFLSMFQDVFAWSYDDMTGISTDIVVHRLPTDPTFPLVKQRPLPVPKKSGEVRVCVDYRDLNKASPKDDFPLPNIHIILNNTAGHEIESFCYCFAGYHQILMAEEDREKTAFITPWGTFCYRVMPFGLKNARATYQRTMTTLFHDMIHKEMEVYVDDIIIKSKKAEDHLIDLRKLFERLQKYNLKLNPAKCAFGAPAGKLLGFIVSKKGIEIDPTKIKAIRDMPVPKTQKDVKSFLGKINFIGRFIAQLTATCEPLFKLLKKNVPLHWNEECQQAFDKIKDYLLHPPILVPPKPGRPLIMYLSVLDGAVGCVLGQHDDSGRKEQAIYYLSKKFTQYEANYSFIEKSCCALAWAAQKLRHYLLSHTTYLISRSDPLKYLLEKPMPTWRLAIKGQAIANHLAENPNDDDYQPLHTYFPDEEVLLVGAAEDMSERCPEWRLFFDGVANSFGAGIGAVLVSPEGKHYPGTAKLQFACTNNMAEYEACIFGLKMALEMEVKELIAFSDSDLLVHQTLKQWITKDSKILPYHCNLLNLPRQFQSLEFRHLPRARNVFVDALATLSSMIQYPDELKIEPIRIQLQDKPAHCWVIDKSSSNSPWYNDIKEFIKTRSYPPKASANDKGFLRRMASKFFLNGETADERSRGGRKQEFEEDHSQDDWHEKLPYALMAYRTSIRISTGATPYSFMYGMEAVLPTEVEIPSLRILMETKLEEADWIKQRYEQLSLIDEKWLNAICHGQCYQKCMAQAYNKKVHLHTFEEGDKVLKRILPKIAFTDESNHTSHWNRCRKDCSSEQRRIENVASKFDQKVQQHGNAESTIGSERAGVAAVVEKTEEGEGELRVRVREEAVIIFIVLSFVANLHREEKQANRLRRTKERQRKKKLVLAGVHFSAVQTSFDHSTEG